MSVNVNDLLDQEKRTGIKKDDIDMVLMVGGSTRIPYVQKFVEKETGLISKSNVLALDQNQAKKMVGLTANLRKKYNC